MKRLAGRVALITGASRGIGRAAASALAKEGADLVLTSTSEGGCASTIDEVLPAGVKAVEVRYEAGQGAAEADRLAQRALEAFGRVDLLINNAGMVIRRPVVEMTDRDFSSVLDVNLTAPFLLVRRLLPAMIARRWGRVINVSSISGTLGSAGHTGYCASKWGLNGLTQTLAEETRGTGVLVAAVLPGSVDTDMLKGSPFPPQMTAADVASTIRFLCAEAPLSLTGSLVEQFG